MYNYFYNEINDLYGVAMVGGSSNFWQVRSPQLQNWTVFPVDIYTRFQVIVYETINCEVDEVQYKAISYHW